MSEPNKNWIQDDFLYFDLVQKKRVCGRERIRTSAFFLTSLAIGSGVLALPYVLRLSGIILGVLMIVCGYFTTYWSFHMIIEADRGSGGHENFKSLFLHCGGKNLSRVYDYSLITVTYGCVVSYQVVIAAMIQSVISEFTEEDIKQFRNYHVVALSLLIVLPVGIIFKEMMTWEYAPVITCGYIFYCSILLFIELPLYITKFNTTSTATYFKLDLNFFDAFGIIFFAFECQFAFYDVTKDLRKKDVWHFKRVALKSNTHLALFYLAVAISGYLSTMDETPDIYVMRRAFFDGKDYFIIFARIVVAGSLMITTVLTYVALRQSVYNQIFTNPEPNNIRNIIFAILVSLSSMALTLIIEKSSVAIAITGGIGSVLVCFGCPGYAYLKTKTERNFEFVSSLLLCGVLTLIGLCSAVHPILVELDLL